MPSAITATCCFSSRAKLSSLDSRTRPLSVCAAMAHTSGLRSSCLVSGLSGPVSAIHAVLKHREYHDTGFRLQLDGAKGRALLFRRGGLPLATWGERSVDLDRLDRVVVEALLPLLA